MGRRRGGEDDAGRRPLEEARDEKEERAAAIVVATQTFDANLERIGAYLQERGRPHVFDALIAELRDKVVPSLQRFPRLGYDFLARKPQSLEGTAAVTRLAKRLGKGASIREYIFGDYLVLYAVRRTELYLLAIRHHLELSFDLRSFWRK